MNCSTNFDLFDENVSDLISVSANVAFTFTTALIFYLSVRNFGSTFYRLLFKLDNFVSIVIILNGVVAIFSALGFIINRFTGADTYNHLLYAERTFIAGCHKPTSAQPCCALETEVNVEQDKKSRKPRKGKNRIDPY